MKRNCCPDLYTPPPAWQGSGLIRVVGRARLPGVRTLSFVRHGLWVTTAMSARLDLDRGPRRACHRVRANSARARSTASVDLSVCPPGRCWAAASSTPHTMASQSAPGTRVIVTKSFTPNAEFNARDRQYRGGEHVLNIITAVREDACRQVDVKRELHRVPGVWGR